MTRTLIGAILLCSALMGSSALALTAEQTVEREIVTLNVDGTETVTRVKAELATPGEKIVYSLNYFNEKDQMAENVVLVMPVPAELVLIDGSAELAGFGATYSADGGETFAARQELEVTLEDDATRPARSEDITHVRWVVDTISPGERGTLSFAGMLK